MKYFVYLLKCADNTFYCGYTTNLENRVVAHNNLKTAAKYTKTRRPVKLYYFKQLDNLSSALKREHQLKKLTHAQKAKLK